MGARELPFAARRHESPAVVTPVARTNLADSVYESLKGMLMDQRVSPDSRLSIDGLARMLEVSPTPVREALARLEAEGLVVRRPNTGFTVAPPPSREQLAEVFDLRLMIEPTCAARAAVNRSKELIAELEQCRAAMDPVEEDKYTAYRAFAAADARLHNALAEASGNPLVLELLLRLRPQLLNFRATQNSAFTPASLQEHHAIIRAVSTGDPDQARTEMTLHLTRSRDRILNAVD